MGWLIAKTEDLEKELNSPQYEAVTYPNGPLLVLAGAGSGKTRVITYRIAYLINLEIMPYQILAVTFTNKAAKEMKSRVVDLVGVRARSMWISTFHSMCARILREYSDIKNFTIYDDYDQLKLIKECLKEFNINEEQYKPSKILASISRAKDNLIKPEEFSTDNTFNTIVKDVYLKYQNKLIENRAYDFDDLISEVIYLFYEKREILSKLWERFRYILVDEYQDINFAQYELIRLLAKKHQNICVVGDDDQCIYQWRGANIFHILNFEKDYSQVKTIKLEENYRSTKSILGAANRVVRYNKQRKEKTLWTNREEGKSIEVFRANNEYEEAEYVASRIIELKNKEGRSEHGFLVLYRVNAQSRIFENIFRRYNLPYTIVGGLSFYQRKEIKDLVAYLRILVNSDDRVSIERVINVPLRGIGQASLKKVRTYAISHKISFFEALSRVKEISSIGKKIEDSIGLFVGLIKYLISKKEELVLLDLVREVIIKSGYNSYLRQEYIEEDAMQRIENIEEFLSMVKEFEENSEDKSLVSFLNQAQLISDIDNWKDIESKVNLMTLHNVKGLEFPVVFLVGLEEGIFPHLNALREDRLEEERRLCYVGITRAKDRLFITYTNYRTWHGVTRESSPSCFLKELEIEEKRVEKNEDSYVAKDNNFMGKVVCHKKWGKGKVIAQRGNGDNLQLTVGFVNGETRVLMNKYAKLEIIR
ncbi:MAG: 3'-5' exonuclease [bacterium]|nr:3'-5' exonuclease [bacterium]